MLVDRRRISVIFSFVILSFETLFGFAAVHDNVNLHSGENSANSSGTSFQEIRSFASFLSKAFVGLANDELGTSMMQTAFDRLQYEPMPKHSEEQILESLVEQLSLRLRHYGHLVSNQRALVSDLYRTHTQKPLAPRFDCCSLLERDLRFETIYGVRVSRRKCCDLVPDDLSSSAFNPGHNLTLRFQRQLDYWPKVKWLYFVTADGLHTEFPAHNFRASHAIMLRQRLDDAVQTNRGGPLNDFLDGPWTSPPLSAPWERSQLPSRRRRRRAAHLSYSDSLFSGGSVYDCRSIHQLRHRDVFVRSVVPKPIWMVLVLDQSEASLTQLLLSQRIARLLLASLSEKDRVSLVLASDTVRIARPPPARTRSPLGQLEDIASHWESYEDIRLEEEKKKQRQHGNQRTGLYLFPAIYETKLLLADYINLLRMPKSTKTNHTRGLTAAFKIIRHAIDAQAQHLADLGEPTTNIMLAYISRGQLDDLQEQNSTLQRVTVQQALLDNRVVINTYMPVDEKSATVLFERKFMHDLASRWNAHSDPQFYRRSDIRPGHFFVINRTTNLVNTVGRFYDLFLPSAQSLHPARARDSSVNSHLSDTEVTVEIEGADESGANDLGDITDFDRYNRDSEFFSRVRVQKPNEPDYRPADSTSGVSKPQSIIYSLPYPDLEGKGLVMSISQAFYDSDSLLGVMGVDVHVGDLLDQISHFGRGSGVRLGSSIAFIVQAPDGYTVAHPALNDLLANPSMPPSKGDVARDASGRLWLLAAESLLAAAAATATTAAGGGPDFLLDPILHMDISQYERFPGFDSLVKPQLLSQANGSVTLSLEGDPERLSLFESTGVWPDGLWNRSASKESRLQNLNVVYHWRRIRDPKTSFIVVLRSIEPASSPRRQLLELIPNFESCYHRLDLFKRDQSCLYLRQLATFSSSSIYLPPRLFMRPYEQLTSEDGETSDQVRHLVAYLIDHTALISNPGLAHTQPSVRSAVAIVERIGKFWRQRGVNSPYRNYIIRRYVATDTGVVLMYPGTLLPQSYDPTIRSWYLRTLQFPGRLIVTGPYLDDGGAGQIITLSYTIFEGNETGVHEPSSGRVRAVLAIDVTHRFMNLLLAKWLPVCAGPSLSTLGDGQAHIHSNWHSMQLPLSSRPVAQHQPDADGGTASEPTAFDLPISFFAPLHKASSNHSLLQFLRTTLEPSKDKKKKKLKRVKFDSSAPIMPPDSEEPADDLDYSLKCLLMDDRGYLSVHPGFSEPRVGAPIESSHINHREPLIGADLLNHEAFVRKLACTSHAHRSLQRSYAFNTSYAGVVTNFASSGEQCNRYQLISISGTNLFFGLVRSAQRGRDCSPRATFCSCSTQNRRCLNCGRMEQRECECPCECPVGMGIGLSRFHRMSTASFEDESDNINKVPIDQTGVEAFPICLQLPTQPHLLTVPKAVASASLKAVAGLPDAPPLCQYSGSRGLRAPVASLQEWLALMPNSSLSTEQPSLVDQAASLGLSSLSGNAAHSLPLIPAWGPVGCNAESPVECAATVGCEWCSLDADGRQLSTAFCAPMGVCFSGIVGAQSPYHNAMASLPPWAGSRHYGSGSNNDFGSTGLTRPNWSPPQALGSQSLQNNFHHHYYYHHYGDQNNYGYYYQHYFDGRPQPIVGSRLALETAVSGKAGADSLVSWPNSPVGPVAGAVMAVFIVVLLGVYCLRHQAGAARQRRVAVAEAAASAIITEAGFAEHHGDSCACGGSGGARSDGTTGATHKNCCSIDKLGCDRPDSDVGGNNRYDDEGSAGAAVALLVKPFDAFEESMKPEEERRLQQTMMTPDSMSSTSSQPDYATASSSGGLLNLNGATVSRADEMITPEPASLEHSSFEGLAQPGYRQVKKLGEFGDAAIVIEGVGVFRRMSAGLEVPLEQFKTDPTAVSPYRVSSDYRSGLCKGALLPGVTEIDSSETNDQLTNASGDNGYVSTIDCQTSSCTEQDVARYTPDLTEDNLQVIARSCKVLPPNPYHCPSATVPTHCRIKVLPGIATAGTSRCSGARSIISDPDSAISSDFASVTTASASHGSCCHTDSSEKSSIDASLPTSDSQPSLGGPWIGTLILGPGMDNMLFDETDFCHPKQTNHQNRENHHHQSKTTIAAPHRLLMRAYKSGLTRLPVLIQRSEGQQKQHPFAQNRGDASVASPSPAVAGFVSTGSNSSAAAWPPASGSSTDNIV